MHMYIFLFSSFGTIIVNNCTIIDDVIYGAIPNAKIDIDLKELPDNNPNILIPFNKSDDSHVARYSRLIPYKGINDPIENKITINMSYKILSRSSLSKHFLKSFNITQKSFHSCMTLYY